MSLLKAVYWYFSPEAKRRHHEALQFEAMKTLADDATKRRANYELLRARILHSHSLRQNGFVIKDINLTLDDLRSFRAPMYRFSFSKEADLCIFWDFDKMSEEIGSPATEGLVDSGEGTESTATEVLSEAQEAGV